MQDLWPKHLAVHGLKLLWIHPQVSDKVDASSFSVSTAEREDSHGLCPCHGLFPPGLWHLSRRQFLSDPWVQAFPSLQVCSGRITKHFSFRGVWWLLGFSYFCITFTLVVSEHFIEIFYFILLTWPLNQKPHQYSRAAFPFTNTL